MIGRKKLAVYSISNINVKTGKSTRNMKRSRVSSRNMEENI